ncbi:flavin reductase family protein [Qipengyuania sp.]|uniref:flavin reductase family protein n=1 Tax=Qipengyuania sp. TaxID=2004515 RepID=UPI0037362AA9
MFDSSAFRSALGSFVTGVTIVTVRNPAGEPMGLTANSFNSVSLDPPMVLWSLSLRSRSLADFRVADSWAVHVLAADQQEMSDRFASPDIDRFSGLEVRDGPEGAPLIEGCAARFGCRARFEYEGGDHAIFLGEVIDFHRRETEPLIYHAGRYGRVMGEAGRGDLERFGYAERAGDGLRLTERGLQMLDALKAVSQP